MGRDCPVHCGGLFEGKVPENVGCVGLGNPKTKIREAVDTESEAH
jgi:hypothetical protein